MNEIEAPHVAHVEGHHVPVVQEDDQVASRSVTRIVVATIVISIVATWISAVLLQRLSRPTTSSREPTVAPRTINFIHQTPIGDDDHGLELRAAQRTAIEGYGWVDRDKGVARIPIERAMQLVVDRPSLATPASSGPEGAP